MDKLLLIASFLLKVISGFAIVVLNSTLTFSQVELNELTVDRPGITEAPFTVSPGHYQLETGFDYYNRAGNEVFFFPTTLFRTGLSKQCEIRVSLKQVIDKSEGEKRTGISPLTVGIKTHIIEQRGWIPETDILADIVFPLGHSGLQPDNIGHDILLLFQSDFSKKTALNVNVGLIWDGLSANEVFTSAFCFNYLPLDRFGFFSEYYNYIRKPISEHGVDGGLTFLIQPLIQADASAGISWANGRRNYFLSTGISFRLP